MLVSNIGRLTVESTHSITSRNFEEIPQRVVIKEDLEEETVDVEVGIARFRGASREGPKTRY
jgi:hypothetical protein